MNITLLEFELGYYDVTVPLVSHDATGTNAPTSKKKKYCVQ